MYLGTLSWCSSLPVLALSWHPRPTSLKRACSRLPMGTRQIWTQQLQHQTTGLLCQRHKQQRWSPDSFNDLPLWSKEYCKNERMEKVGIVWDSAEWDPEFHRKELINWSTVSIMTADNKKSQTQTPCESWKHDVHDILSCGWYMAMPMKVETIAWRNEKYPWENPHD